VVPRNFALWYNTFFILGGIMSKIEAALLAFLIIMLIVFLSDYFIIKLVYLRNINNPKKKKKKKDEELLEILYLSGKFKIDKNKLNDKRILRMTSFINAFIISLVSVVIILIHINIILRLLIGFVLLMGLIYSLYELYGRYLKKKGLD
jgi:purine-cytosine permease-like protein